MGMYAVVAYDCEINRYVTFVRKEVTYNEAVGVALGCARLYSDHMGYRMCVVQSHGVHRWDYIGDVRYRDERWVFVPADERVC